MNKKMFVIAVVLFMVFAVGTAFADQFLLIYYVSDGENFVEAPEATPVQVVESKSKPVYLVTVRGPVATSRTATSTVTRYDDWTYTVKNAKNETQAKTAAIAAMKKALHIRPDSTGFSAIYCKEE